MAVAAMARTAVTPEAEFKSLLYSVSSAVDELRADVAMEELRSRLSGPAPEPTSWTPSERCSRPCSGPRPTSGSGGAPPKGPRGPPSAPPATTSAGVGGALPLPLLLL